MKIFAIKDRMIDYFMVPFCAPDDKQAQAGIAVELNRADIDSAINQAPHHFELYLLGEIDDNGTIFPQKELICDCSSLIRARRSTPESEAAMALRPTQTPRGSTNGAGNAPNANTEALPKSAPEQHLAS